LNKQKEFKGLAASPGISIGKAFVYSRSNFEIDAQPVGEGDLAKEISEFHLSLELSKKELTKIRKLSEEKIGEKNAKIFDAQIDILNDKYFINNIEKRITDEKRTASFIFDEEMMKLSKALVAANNEYLKERSEDIKDIRNRVIRNMRKEKLVSKVPEYSIIISHELTPADTILFSKREIQGYATDKGGMTSHAAIISRALNIPSVVGMKDISVSLKTGDFIIIDGINGLVIKNPTADMIDEYKQRLSDLKLHETELKEQFGLPSRTADGREVELSANIEFDEEINFVVNAARCGVGLYRTEHLFLEAGDFPSEDRQIEEYAHIANMTFPNPVTIRTYDIGGDKLLPRSEKEDNPFLGWRGIRICLDRVEIFKEQLSALLRSSEKGNLKIMFPMISSLTEVIRAKEILSEVKSDLDSRGLFYDKDVKVGIMIEVPSAYFLADELAKEVDFFSIGTNDLIQYLLAVDRGNQFISGLFQQFHPAVLRAIKVIVDAGNRNGIPVSICGEMASKPLATAVLLGLGLHELSVVPSVYTEIKQIIRKLKFSETVELADRLLMMTNESDIARAVKLFCEERDLLPK